MFKHTVEVNGDYIQGDINNLYDLKNEKEELIFNLVQYWKTEGCNFNSQQLRSFANELNKVANELDKLNGKNTLVR